MSQEIYFWEGDRQRLNRLIEGLDRLSMAIEKLEAIPTTPEIEKKIISGITSEEL